MLTTPQTWVPRKSIYCLQSPSKIFKESSLQLWYRHIIVTAGCLTLGLGQVSLKLQKEINIMLDFKNVGFALFFIKCTCFCRPKPGKNEKNASEKETKYTNGTKVRQFICKYLIFCIWKGLNLRNFPFWWKIPPLTRTNKNSIYNIKPNTYIRVGIC